MISHQRKVSASQIPLGLDLELDVHFWLGIPFSQMRLWRVNYLFWQKTQGGEQEEDLKDDSHWNYMTAKIIFWGLTSSRPS